MRAQSIALPPAASTARRAIRLAKLAVAVHRVGKRSLHRPKLSGESAARVPSLLGKLRREHGAAGHSIGHACRRGASSGQTFHFIVRS